MNDSFYKSQRSVPAGKMEQLAYTEKAKAKKTMDLQVIPDAIIPDASAAGVLVGKGNLCRVKGTNGGFIAFGAVDVAAPTNLTANTMETEAKYFFIVATDDYVRTSAAMRIEVIND